LALRQLKEIQRMCTEDFRKCQIGTAHHRTKLNEARKEFGGEVISGKSLKRSIYCKFRQKFF